MKLLTWNIAGGTRSKEVRLNSPYSGSTRRSGSAVSSALFLNFLVCRWDREGLLLVTILAPDLRTMTGGFYGHRRSYCRGRPKRSDARQSTCASWGTHAHYRQTFSAGQRKA